MNRNFSEPIQNLELVKEVITRLTHGSGFTNIFGELSDPDPVLRKLGKDITVYSDLISDDQVGSTITRRKNGVKSLKYSVTAGEKVTEKEIQICKSALANLTKSDGKRKNKVKDIIDQSLNPIFWGYSVFEVTWERVGKYILPRFIEEKPQNWFNFDNQNLLWFKPNISNNSIPLNDQKFKYKFILLQNSPTYENPYGDKALSRCFWPVTFKRGGIKFFSLFVEKYGMPHVTGMQPRGLGKEKAEDLLLKLNNMVRDAVAVIPDDSSVKIHKTGEKASADIYKSFIDINNRAIDKAILTNSLSTEQLDKGGYSSSKTGVDVEKKLAKQDKDFPCELFNEIFRMVIDINLGSGVYPAFEFLSAKKVNTELAERDQLLSKRINFSKKYFQRKYNLDENDFELRTKN